MFKELKNVIYAVLITSIFIFIFVKTVEAQDAAENIHGVHSIINAPQIVLDDSLKDKELAVMVLGGIDYYVQECTPLTSRGVIYRNKIINLHKLNAGLLPINPTYIKGALAVSGYDCYEMYELIESLEQGVIEEPEQPVDKETIISEDLLTSQ